MSACGAAPVSVPVHLNMARRSPIPQVLLYVEAEPPGTDDKQAERERHRHLVADAAEQLGALGWDSSDIDHWLVDIETAMRYARPGAPAAWTSYYRPIYRLDFAPERDWPAIRRELETLLPGWHVRLWTGDDVPPTA